MNPALQSDGEKPDYAASDARVENHRPAQPLGARRIAFGIVSLFPGGGLQRNCLAIAQILRRRGHDVVVFAARVDGTLPKDVPIEVLPNRALTNHGRNRRFAADLAGATRHRFDLVVGFDKLPGLDLVYCADPAVAARTGWRRLTPRHRVLRALEGSCFAAGEHTRIIALSPAQIEGYRRTWHTEAERIALLPPNLEPERRHPERRRDGSRERRRAALGIAPEHWCWLAIGRQPQHKGFDRAVAALEQFPAARLLIVGLAASHASAAPLRKLARRRGVADRLALLGFVPDAELPDVMAAADLLIHPARADTTGTVILEAIVNGLPVITTAVCGYADHVRAADAGAVVPEPFAPAGLLAALRRAREPSAAQWSANAMRYGERAELYSGLEVAADLILRAKSLRRSRESGNP